MKVTDEKTPAELAEEERQASIARGDIVDDDELAKAAAEEEAEEETEEEEAEEEEVLAAAAEEEEEEEEEDEPGDSPDDEINVPKARFDETRKAARIKEAALEARIRELEGAAPKKDVVTLEMLETEIEELEDEYEKYLLEGETVEAKAKRREVSTKRNALMDRKIKEGNSAMGAAAVEQVRYDNQLAALEIKYPAMNPDAVEFDKVVSDEIDTLMNAFEASGMTLAAALNKAVHYALGSVTVEKETDEDEGESKADKVKRERKLRANKKALKAIKKTPTDLDGVGKNSDKAGRDDGLPDPLKMTQTQFDKLTEKQKAELRDDTMKPH